MLVERDSRGKPQFVSKKKDKGKHRRSKHAGRSFDRPVRGDDERAPLPPRGDNVYPSKETSGPPPHGIRLPDRSRKRPTDNTRGPSGSNRHPRARDQGDYVPTRGPEHYPPAPDPPRDRRPPARPPHSPKPAHRDRPWDFDEKSGVRRPSKKLYEEAFWKVFPDTGTEYPCTQSDLDACGGEYRQAFSGRPSEDLKKQWFSQPNQRKTISFRKAAIHVYRYNTLRPAPYAEEDKIEEYEAIERMRRMLDNACHGIWGPDVAIKCFCDLDMVFFSGKLRNHVCITWAGPEEFPSRTTFGHTKYLDKGKALIQMNARYIFLKRDHWHDRPVNQTLATMLHEMCHAYQMVNCWQHDEGGRGRPVASPIDGHGKCFGSMMHAVNARAFQLLGVKGDPTPYPSFNYSNGEGFE